MIGRSIIGAICLGNSSTKRIRIRMVVAGIVSFGLFYIFKRPGITEVSLFAVFVMIIIGFTLRSMRPARMLVWFAGMNIVILILVEILSIGEEMPSPLSIPPEILSFWYMTGMGLFNSIMFSNIFTLAIRELDGYTLRGSSLLIMMCSGGALLPLFLSYINISFFILLICYAYIMFYGVLGYRIRKKEDFSNFLRPVVKKLFKYR